MKGGVLEAADLSPEVRAKLGLEYEKERTAEESAAALEEFRAGGRRGSSKAATVPKEVRALLYAAEDLMRDGLHGVFNGYVTALADACGAVRRKGI